MNQDLTATLAKQKNLPLKFLHDLQVHDYPGGIFIQYRKQDGSLADRQRLRLGLKSKDGFKWMGKGEIVPYGLWMPKNGPKMPRVEKIVKNVKQATPPLKLEPTPKDARNSMVPCTFGSFLILVEGESDCWTLWFHGFACLGIPGSTCVKFLKLEHLAGIKTVFVWQEPDKGGEVFVSGLAKHLFEIGFLGKVKVLKIDGYKDPSEIHIREGKNFKKIMNYLMVTASLSTPYSPPIQPRSMIKFSKTKGFATEEQIKRAELYPISGILGVKVGTKILCPEHEDSSPSLHVYPHRVYCFACGYSDNSIGWMRRRGMSFKEAVQALQD